MNILQIGLSYKTAPVEVREKLAFTPNMLRSALTHFDQTHHQRARLPDVREGVILSTCNRVEIYALVQDVQAAQESLIEFLALSCDVSPDFFMEYLYVYQDEEVVEHLLRVSAGLDSMVLGEPQILGQITDAYEVALSQGAAGTVLSALFRAAIHTGKRARTETAISVNPASISSVAASLAENLLGDLAKCRVLLVGAGEMGEIAVKALINRGVTDIVVVNRTYENAEQLANNWGGKALSFQKLAVGITDADIIITSTGAPHTIINRKLLEPVIKPEKPIFLIDIAVPRDIDPDVTELSHLHLYDIDDLQSQVKDNVRERESEVPRVERIVMDETVRFSEWMASLDVVSTITDLRRRAEEIRQFELQRLFNRVDLDEREQELVATMSHRLINKIFHPPTLRLKQEAVNGNGPAYTSMVRHLFALDEEFQLQRNGTAKKSALIR